MQHVRRHTIIVLLFLFAGWWAALNSGCGAPSYKQGENLYRTYCANCHMEDGSGLAQLIPPLASSDWLRDNQDTLPCIIYHGMSGPIIVNGIEFDGQMPSNKQLTPVLINNIINYINHAWGNDFGQADIRHTEAALEKCR